MFRFRESVDYKHIINTVQIITYKNPIMTEFITTLNPYSQIVLDRYEQDSKEVVLKKMELAQDCYDSWRFTDIEQRTKCLLEVSRLLKKRLNAYAIQISLEMGKPIAQAASELEKCAWLCEYYSDNAPSHLENELIETEFYKSYVTYESLGVLLGVMPWNYPFWQVIRFAAPALMVGNVVLIKHASSVMGCSQMLEELFVDAGFPVGCYQNLIIKSDAVSDIIANPIIKAVTLTGSMPAGSAVASKAAAHIKKSVLELGGNNALVVFPDAHLEHTLETVLAARFQNTGQSCIAGKRLIIHESIAERFIEMLTTRLKEFNSGNPLHKTTYIGVMSSVPAAIELEKQMKDSLQMGATLIIGGKRDGAYFEPTILNNVTIDMPVFREETFGPLLAVTTFKNEQQAIELASDSDFGLGVSLFSEDTDKMERLVPHFKDGAVFINQKVGSHPALPFGGTGVSGYGRELSHHGIKEFCNVKTVVVHKTSY